MTVEKLKSVFVRYREFWNEWDTKWEVKSDPKQMSAEDAAKLQPHIAHDVLVAHYKFMCDEGIRLADAGKVEKAMRWLGFLQGAMWMDGLFTLDELKDHSRPDEPEAASQR